MHSLAHARAGKCLFVGMQDKNKDFVVTEHQTLMASSTLPFVAQLFQEALDSGEGYCWTQVRAIGYCYWLLLLAIAIGYWLLVRAIGYWAIAGLR